MVGVRIVTGIVIGVVEVTLVDMRVVITLVVGGVAAVGHLVVVVTINLSGLDDFIRVREVFGT